MNKYDFEAFPTFIDDINVKLYVIQFNQSINQSIEIFSVAQIESITETTKA